MSSYHSFLINENNKYYTFSMMQQQKQKDFLNKMTILNKKTGELTKMDYDFAYHQKNTALWYNFVSTHINNKNSHKTAIFITLTLKSSFHPFKKVFVKSDKGHFHIGKKDRYVGNGRYYYNKNYDKNNTVNVGYRLLNDSYRKIIKDFKIDGKYKAVKYFKVIEPHKDFTPHLHALVFVDDNYVDDFKLHLVNYIKICGLGDIYDIQVLNETKSATSYIMKYVKKSLFSDDISKLFVIDGWKKINKIRMVTHSNVDVPRYFFDKVSKNIDLSFGMDEYDIIQNLMDNVNFNIRYVTWTNRSEPFKIKSNSVDNKKYNVDVDIVVSTVRNYDIPEFDITNKYSFYKFIDMLVDDNFDFYSLMKYEYDEFDYLGTLEYLSKDYDFRNYYSLMHPYDFRELFLNYMYEVSFNDSKIYKIVDFVIKEDDRIVYDKKDFLLYSIV